MITGLRLPLPWAELGFADPFLAGTVSLWSGARAWVWSSEPPDVAVRVAARPDAAEHRPGWGIDHVVLLVPSLQDAQSAIEPGSGAPRRRVEVRGRKTAFWVVGTLLEVVEESSVDRPLLYGVSLTFDGTLQEVVDDWRRRGFEVTSPRAAFQAGREIFTVAGLDAGLAVMTPR